MRLVSIDDRRPGLGSAGAVLAGGDVLRLSSAVRPDTIEAWLPDTVSGILAAGSGGLDVVREVVARAEGEDEGWRRIARAAGYLLPPDVPLQAPVGSPTLVLAAGLAYKSHLAEMSGTPTPPHPTAFLKVPSSVVGPGPLTLPPAAREQVDFEGELAVVFGRVCHAVGEGEALDYVAGYMAANDFSARDWVREVWSAERPWDARRTWEVNIMGKQFAGFTALGPALLTADEVPDPAALRLRTVVSGEVMQDAPVSDLIFPVARMIAWFSRWYTFRPGDVMLTGTPAGVGVGRHPPRFLKPGDDVIVEIGPIGALSTLIGD